MRRGWFRLWVVATVIAVPAVAIWIASIDMHSWRQQFDWHWKICDANHEFVHETMDQCLHSYGADQDIYQQEGMTRLTYWTMMIGVSFIVDLLVTGVLLAVFLTVRWVVRGFNSGAGVSIEEWYGRTFEGRGQVDFGNFKEGVESLQQMSTENVATHSLSKGFGGVLAGMELRRRENWTGRAALVVSILALVVSVIGAIFAAFRH